MEEFWYGESRLTEVYREAHELKMDMVNQQLWLQGLYNLDALQSALSSLDKNTRHQYLKEPLPRRQKPETPEEARQKVVDQLNAWKEAFDKRREENGSIEHK